MKRKIIPVLIICGLIIGVFLPLTVQASAKSVSTATKSIDADIPSLDDDTVNIFVDMLYDRNSELYQEVMDVLKQKKEGTYEIFADIYSKIYSVYGLATTDDLIYFSVENAVMNTMNISSTLDLIKGAVDIINNVRDFSTDVNAMQKTVNSLQVLEGFLTLIHCRNMFPSSLSLILSVTDMTMCLAGYLEWAYFKEAETLYGYELELAYWSGGELPYRQAPPIKWNSKITQKDADDIYTKLYMKYYTRRLVDNLNSIILNTPHNNAVNFDGHSYRVIDLSLTWSEAKSYCESLGGYLVTITSQEEQDHLIEIANESNKRNLWIGAKRDEAGTYRWITDESFSYTNWAPDEPNNVNNSQFTAMMYTQKATRAPGLWNDENENGCDWNGYTLADFGFVCEWDCEFDIVNGHTLGAWEETIKQKCIENGRQERKCQFCNYSEYKKIDSLGHYFEEQIELEATCIKSGSKIEVCRTCGYKTDAVEIVAIGHTEGKVVVENLENATCTKSGSFDSVTYCETCDFEIHRSKEFIEATGHVWNCNEESQMKICDICGEIQEENLPSIEDITNSEEEIHKCDPVGNWKWFLNNLINFFRKLFGIPTLCPHGFVKDDI